MAENVPVQGIEFEIRGNAEKASQSLLSFADNLKKANKASTGKGLQTLADNLKQIADALSRVDGTGISSLADALNSIKGKAGSLEKIANYMARISYLDFSNLSNFSAAMASIPTRLPNDGKQTKEKQGTTEPAHKWKDIYEEAKKLPSLWNDIEKAEKAASEGVRVDSLQNWLEHISPLKTIAGTIFQPIAGALASLEEKFNQSGITIGDWFKGFARNEQLVSENAHPLIESFDNIRLALVQIAEGAMKAALYIGGKLLQAFKKIASVSWSAAKAVGKFAANLAISPFKKAIAEAEKFAKKMGQVGAAFKRILFYRLVRSAIKAIGEALQEGTENAYWFSKNFGDSTSYIAQAYDKLNSASYKMGNQMGAAWATLYAQIAPIIEQIIGLITRAMQVITQFLSLLGGKGTYMKAIDYTKDWAEETKKGGSAAKEWKNQLMGFDEINRLEEPSKGGGGGTEIPDYDSMFDESPIEAKIKSFYERLKKTILKEDWQSLGTLLAKKINSIFPSEEQWGKWGEKLGGYLKGAINTAYYFFENLDFSGFGAKVAALINALLTKALETDNGGDFATNLGKLLIRKTTIGLDFFLGLLGNLNWKNVGTTIGNFLRGAIKEASDWLKSKGDWSQIGKNVWAKFKDAIAGIDFNSLADSFFSFLGTAFGAVVAFLDGFFSETVQKIKDYFKQKTAEAGGDAWEGFKKGIADAASTAWSWIKTHIIEPFVNAFKEILGIHSPSTVFADIGKNVIDGLWQGISKAWASFKEWFTGIFSSLIDWCKSAHTWLQDVLDGINLVNQNSGSLWTEETGFTGRLGKFASGGYPQTGQVFIAREYGNPELVGNIGGRTAVANNDQITTAIAEAVYGAIVAGMPQGGNNTPVIINLDGREIARTTTKYQNQFARAGG